jgi:transcriptional regulator with XRE-family HTH domain
MAIAQLNDNELQQARDQSWNPAVRRLLDWYFDTRDSAAAAAAPAAPIDAAPALPTLVISLAELRKLAGITQAQIAGLMRSSPARVEDIESLDLELLDVDQLLQYTTALGMALTITVDLVPGAVRELISTRGKVDHLQREQQIASLKPGGQHTSETHGLGPSPAPSLAELGQQVVDGSNAIRDTQPPGSDELPGVVEDNAGQAG